MQLFAQHGFRDTRISDIAEEADVSEATFFRYFSSKEEVALVDLMSRIESALDTLAARPVEESPLTACLAMADTEGALGLVPRPGEALTVQLVVANPSLSGYFFWQITQVTGRLAAEFARRLGSEPNAFEPQLLASSVIAVMDAVLRTWLTDPTISPRTLAVDGFTRLANGFEPR
jgi:AcrR family transcriptional regulator